MSLYSHYPSLPSTPLPLLLLLLLHLLLFVLLPYQVAMNVAYDLGDDAWRQLGMEALRQGMKYSTGSF